MRESWGYYAAICGLVVITFISIAEGGWFVMYGVIYSYNSYLIYTPNLNLWQTFGLGLFYFLLACISYIAARSIWEHDKFGRDLGIIISITLITNSIIRFFSGIDVEAHVLQELLTGLIQVDLVPYYVFSLILPIFVLILLTCFRSHWKKLLPVTNGGDDPSATPKNLPEGGQNADQ